MAPAALPYDQPQAWASGRYVDGMIIVFFLVGAAVCTGLFLLAALTVAVYIGTTVPTDGFGAGFNFAEPAVVTQTWTNASVALATAVTLVLLAVWIGFAFVLRTSRRNWRRGLSGRCCGRTTQG
jgi:ABC-type Fe3+ transport system permease subunit